MSFNSVLLPFALVSFGLATFVGCDSSSSQVALDTVDFSVSVDGGPSILADAHPPQEIQVLGMGCEDTGVRLWRTDGESGVSSFFAITFSGPLEVGANSDGPIGNPAMGLGGAIIAWHDEAWSGVYSGTFEVASATVSSVSVAGDACVLTVEEDYSEEVCSQTTLSRVTFSVGMPEIAGPELCALTSSQCSMAGEALPCSCFVQSEGVWEIESSCVTPPEDD